MIPKEWRPKGWIDAYSELHKTGKILSSVDCYELGADEMLRTIAGTIEQKTGKKLEELLNEYV